MGKLGFIGMGIMGLPMAGHLMGGGHQLWVNSRTASRAKPLLDKGAVYCATPEEVARQAEILFVCVPDTPDVVKVVMDPKEGVLSGAREGLIVVDQSTISPKATVEMAAACAKRGVAYLDAPVTGGDIGAINATLTIFVGGEEAVFARVKPCFELMGKRIFHCGKNGMGQMTKLMNQILVALNNLAGCEALAFAKGVGLQAEAALEAVGGGAAGSWQLNNLGPKILAGNFAPGFMIDLMLKDLKLVLAAAKEAGLDLPATDLVTRLYGLAHDQGDGRLGTQALAKQVG